jgi:hypothetical protein
MNRNRVMLFAVVCIGLISIGYSAQAACVQGDLQGNWQAYVMNNDAEWNRCAMKFSSTGGASGSCTNSSGSTDNITSGKLTVNSNCLVTGNFSMSNGGKVTIQHATMGKDKFYLLGVGRDNQGGLFLFDAAKK